MLEYVEQVTRDATGFHPNRMSSCARPASTTTGILQINLIASCSTTSTVLADALGVGR